MSPAATSLLPAEAPELSTRCQDRGSGCRLAPRGPWLLSPPVTNAWLSVLPPPSEGQGGQWVSADECICAL